MKELYSISGLSKQALFKYRKRLNDTSIVRRQVLEECNRIRKNHKRMSCRRMYWRSSVPVGRDIFEQIGFANGYKIQVKRKTEKTTWSQTHEVYDNLIEGRTINGINQIFQSDIFYLKVEEKNYYGVTIIDVYSRRLLAVNISTTLAAIENIKALQQAIRVRKNQSLKDCIFHSDRGSQYISNAHKQLLKDQQMIPSMCKLPQENAYVERVQGTLKHEYLFEYSLTCEQIQKQINHIMYCYNHERPHTQLGNKTPIEFENYVQQLVEKDRPQLAIYQWSNPLLTKKPVANKKEKRTKKEKNYTTTNY